MAQQYCHPQQAHALFIQAPGSDTTTTTFPTTSCYFNPNSIATFTTTPSPRTCKLQVVAALLLRFPPKWLPLPPQLHCLKQTQALYQQALDANNAEIFDPTILSLTTSLLIV